MKFEKIVAFGDSWIWGDELLDPQLQNHPQAHPVLSLNTPYREKMCFLGILGDHFGTTTENFGIAGGSLQSTIWTYLWWTQNEKMPLDRCLVLIGLTSPNRHSFINPKHVFYSNDPPWNKFVHSTWAHSGSVDSEWTDMIKRWTTLTSCNDLDDYNYKQAVMFFEGQQKINQNVVQFRTIKSNISFQNSSLIYPTTSLQEMLLSKPYMLAPKGHANEEGHRFIASLLINSLKSATII